MTRAEEPVLDLEMTERLARVADMQKTAQALLDDPEAVAAFRRVGVSGDFTPQEHEAIYERLGLGAFDPYGNIGVALDYQGIVQALARRVAAGVYGTVFDEEGHIWALSNTFVGAYALPTRTGNPIFQQRIPFEDYLVVLREYMAWDKLQELLNALNNFEFDPNSEHDEDEQLYEAAAPLRQKSRELFRKHGHIGVFDVSIVASELIRDGKTADDIDAVRHHATLWRSTSLIEGIAK